MFIFLNYSKDPNTDLYFDFKPTHMVNKYSLRQILVTKEEVQAVKDCPKIIVEK